MKWLRKIWCKLFHKKLWHVQKYTDRSRYSVQVECWRCEIPHSPLRVVPSFYQKHIDSYNPTINQVMSGKL